MNVFIFGIQTPSMGTDNSLAIIAAACAQQQVLFQELLLKMLNRIVWQKVLTREFWPTCHENCGSKDCIANLCLDKKTFLLIVERLAPYIHWETTRMR